MRPFSVDTIFNERLIEVKMEKAEVLGCKGIEIYREKMRLYPILKETEERKLFIQFQNGDKKAWQTLIYSNFRLLEHIAKKYENRGLPLEDLMQEGAVGLIHAIERFNMEYKVRFPIYAGYWIRQAMIDALNKSVGPLYLPRKIKEKRNELFWETNQILIATGKESTVSELAMRLNTKESKVRELLLYTVMPVPYDELSDQNTQISTEQKTKCIDSSNLLEALLSTLPQTERIVLQCYYGTDGNKRRTLKEIGELLDISAERVRQLKNRAIRKLQHPARKKGFEELWKLLIN